MSAPPSRSLALRANIDDMPGAALLHPFDSLTGAGHVAEDIDLDDVFPIGILTVQDTLRGLGGIVDQDVDAAVQPVSLGEDAA